MFSNVQYLNLKCRSLSITFKWNSTFLVEHRQKASKPYQKESTFRTTSFQTFLICIAWSVDFVLCVNSLWFCVRYDTYLSDFSSLPPGCMVTNRLFTYWLSFSQVGFLCCFSGPEQNTVLILKKWTYKLTLQFSM